MTSPISADVSGIVERLMARSSQMAAMNWLKPPTQAPPCNSSLQWRGAGGWRAGIVTERKSRREI